jgi:hypothetical protein
MKPTCALFIQFIENQKPVPVLSINRSSSGGASQTAFDSIVAQMAEALCYKLEGRGFDSR